MKFGYIILAVMVVMLVPALARSQVTVTAEAIAEANLRADTTIESEQVGRIVAGTRYPVVGRSEFFPWLLLGDPATNAPVGWVFQDLVVVNGDINTVAFSTEIVSSVVVPTPSLAPTAAPQQQPTQVEGEQPLFGVAIPATATATPRPAVVGRFSGEVNIRYGPGVQFPRVGVARPGDEVEVTAYHTTLPWVQLRYDDVAGGFGWVAIDLLEISGDIYALPAITTTSFALPTLTPTPPAVQASTLVGDTLSPQFRALGDSLWAQVLAAGFEPETSRLGSLFLMDLQSGEALTFGNDIAFSGTSLAKIGILISYYRLATTLPNGEQALDLANMMICSFNRSSNNVLTRIGGDPFAGATYVTETLRQLQLQNTFVAAPFFDDNRITPQPVIAPESGADQTRTALDPFNQMTVDELGYLLAAVYQCATTGNGPLITAFAGDITQQECQQMLHLMSQNEIGALIEVGLPEGTRVAHKHGWIADTHGDAGIVFSPGGDYVLVMSLYNPEWLNFGESFPLMEEMSRTVYNYYNPDAPLPATRDSNVPATCDISGSTIVDDLMLGVGIN